MRFPRRRSVWDGGSTAPPVFRGGRDPINPVRVAILRRRGMTYRAIGELIAKQDGRAVAYLAHSVQKALLEYRCGRRDEDGERIPDSGVS